MNKPITNYSTGGQVSQSFFAPDSLRNYQCNWLKFINYNILLNNKLVHTYIYLTRIVELK